MGSSSTAEIKYNQSPSDPNDQWLPVQPRGEVKQNKWAQTINEVTGGQVPIQWTSDLENVTESEAIDFNNIDQPANFFIIAEKGRRSNPKVFDALVVKNNQESFDLTFAKFVRRNDERGGSRIFIGFVSDRNIWDDANLPGRGNQ